MMMTLNVHLYRTLHFDENYHGDDDSDEIDDNHDDNTEHSGASSL